jgi:dihydroorotate dehydrogenase
MDLYKNILRPILFTMDPEDVHDLSVKFLKTINKLPIKNDFCYQEKFKKKICGLDFKNPVGLAAGFDKNGELIDEMKLLGFGFIEVGTITPRPQLGNPRPRVFRIQKDQSLLNFMGFNNDGVVRVARRLEKRKSDIIVGANIGKNRLTEFEKSHLDYVSCIKYLHDLVDYFTINISSPNTQGLRKLSNDKPLKILLQSIQDQNKSKTTKPIFLKISPDMGFEDLSKLLDACVEFEIDGVVATNTTVNHNYFKGGLSGQLLSDNSLKYLKFIKSHTEKLTIISSGGIMNKQIAAERFNEGADLIQLYTGLVYGGPLLIRDILKNLS